MVFQYRMHKVETLKKSSVIIVKSDKAVEWESLDEKPVNVAISLLVPRI